MSINKSRYDKIIILTVLLSILFIFLLTLLNLLTYPYVREVKLLNKQGETADLTSQILQVSFSRPMVQSAATVEIFPSTNTTQRWVGSNLYVIFDEILDSDTNYEIKISSDFQDSFGRRIEEGIKYTFQTKRQLFAYKQKDNDGEHIMFGDTKLLEPKKIFSAQNIKMFSPTSQVIATVITSEQGFDDLIIINLDGSILFKLNQQSKIIPNLTISPNGSNIIFTAQNAIRSQDITIPKGQSELFLLDTNSFQVSEMSLNETNLEVIDIHFAPDSKSLIYRSADGFYYITSLDSPEYSIILGRFTAFAGFNSSQKKILFTTFDPLQTYSSFPFIQIFDSNRILTQVTKADRYVTNPVFFTNKAFQGLAFKEEGLFDEREWIIFSSQYQEFVGTRGLMELLITDSAGANITKLYKIEGMSLEMSSISNDGKFLSAEMYTPIQLSDYTAQRLFINETKPANADIVIIDMFDQSVLMELSDATDFFWFL